MTIHLTEDHLIKWNKKAQQQLSFLRCFLLMFKSWNVFLVWFASGCVLLLPTICIILTKKRKWFWRKWFYISFSTRATKMRNSLTFMLIHGMMKIENFSFNAVKKNNNTCQLTSIENIKLRWRIKSYFGTCIAKWIFSTTKSKTIAKNNACISLMRYYLD